MKVVVYAIAKNEAAFARRWMESMAEADAVVVLDTGSTDGTPQLLRELGAQVTEEEITPWRFDAARNRSLELVPEDADICVCTDLDELFHPGWRALLEAAWKPGCSQAVYRYTWNFREDGSEGVVFWYEKVHTRHGFRWCWSGSARGVRGPRSQWRECSWTTGRTQPNPGRSIWGCWSCLSGRRRRMTAMSTIWGGNTFSGVAGTTVSAR